MSVATPSVFFSAPQRLLQDKPIFALVDWASENAADSRYSVVMIEHNPHDAGLREFAKQKSLISLGVVCSEFSLTQGRDMLGELRRALEEPAQRQITGDDDNAVYATLAYVRAMLDVVDDAIARERQFVHVRM